MSDLINLSSAISLSDASRLIESVGADVTVLLRSEPGCGKSSMLKTLAQRMPGYAPVYVDAPLLDIADIYMPCEDKASMTTHYAPNAFWRLAEGKPLLIMLDELMKAAGPTKLILTRLILERTLGDYALPEGSIVFATSNDAKDGIGDSLAAHLQNRVCVVDVRKPSSDEWCTWALDNNVAPEVIAFAKHFPQALQSYRDLGSNARDNPYIFVPGKPAGGSGAFVSPRSLHKASAIVKARSVLGQAASLAALCGTIGEAAARDMDAFLTVADKLPAWATLVADPLDVKLPEEDTAALLVLLFSMVARVTQDTLTPAITLVQRLPAELQALFMVSLSATNKRMWAVKNKLYTDWCRANAVLFIEDTGGKG